MFHRSSSVSIKAVAYATTCGGNLSSVHSVKYNWELYNVTFDEAQHESVVPSGVFSTSNDDRFFKVDEYALHVQTYVLLVTVTDTTTNANNSAYSYLNVTRASVTAVITGADRTVSRRSREVVELSAASSYDDDVATDDLGGEGSADINVTVFSTNPNATEVEKFLAFAFTSDFETVCQAVVTCATASVSDLLVDALFTVSEIADADTAILQQISIALEAVVTASPLTFAYDAAYTALFNLTYVFAMVSSEIGITSTTAISLGNTASSLLESSLFNASNVTSATNTLLDLLDAICSAQLLDAIVGEYADYVTSANLQTSAQRFMRNSTTGTARSLEPRGSAQSSADLPTSIGSDDDQTYSVWFAEVDFKQYSTVTSSHLVRFGISSTEEARRRRRRRRGRRRRRLEEEEEEEEEDADAITIDLNIYDEDASDDTAAESGNVSCACGFYGNVSYQCKDDTTVDVQCDGAPGIYEVTCPSSTSSCDVWFDGSATCDPVVGSNQSKTTTTTCRCSITSSSKVSVSTSSRETAMAKAYTSQFHDAPDAERAEYMLVAIAVIFTMCLGLVATSRVLDHRDRTGAAPDMLSRRNEQRDEAGLSSHYDELEEYRSWKWFRKELRMLHPLTSWYCYYSPSVPRYCRAWNIGFDVLTFAFGLCLETNMTRPVHPGCDAKMSQDDCDELKMPYFAGGHELCRWDLCSQTCVVREPALSQATSERYYLVVALVLFCSLPLTMLYSYLFDNYLIAPAPSLAAILRHPGGGPAAADEEDEERPRSNGGGGGGGGAASDSELRRRDDADAGAGRRGDKFPEAAAAAQRSEECSIETCEPSVDYCAPELLAPRRRRRRDEVFLEALESSKSQLARMYSVVERATATVAARFRKKRDDCSIILKKSRASREAAASQRARALAPQVCEMVVAQLGELRGLISHIESSDISERYAVLEDLQALSQELMSRWGWVGDATYFEANVVAVLRSQAELAASWHAALHEKILSCDDDDDDDDDLEEEDDEEDDAAAAKLASSSSFEARVSKMLVSFEHVARMTPLERRVVEMCRERSKFELEAPSTPPPPGEYALAWIVVVSMVAFMAYYLVASASLWGHKKSRLWLISLGISFALTYAFVLPCQLFFFSVWCPRLVVDRLTVDHPRSRRRFPFKTQTPTALTALLAMEPRAAETAAARALVSSVDDDLGAAWWIDGVPEIARDELWVPTIDTRVLVLFVGAFTFLPDFLQELVFDEIINFVPFFAAKLLPTH
ncbi:hypothetical protein CTAYLR_009194, partial [Chrysophaeum taylorii]